MVVRARRIAVLAVMIAFAATGSATAAPRPSGADRYVQTNLVSDVPGLAEVTDPNLVNPWGLSAGPTTPVWASDEGTGLSTLYSGGVNGSAVTKVPLVVTIPGGHPTGTVFNASPAFQVGGGTARFLFATLTGNIVAWQPALGTTAAVVWNTPGAVYTGLTLAGTHLYAADFAGAKIDVFDSAFHPTRLKAPFRDPNLPAGYAPFNVQALYGQLYVAYAKQGADGDEEPGPGLGFVDVFSTTGKFVRRLAGRGPLNAPWGLVRAPNHFGAFSGDVLVGNFGDGTINAYDPKTGHYQGHLLDTNGQPIVNTGLWGLRFGNGTFAGTRQLVFAAGINDEENGLLGTLTPVFAG